MANVESIQAWRRSGVIALALIALTLGLYWETLQYLISRWNQLEIGEYGHGYLVLGISLYLIQRKLRAITSFTPSPSVWGLLAVTVAGLLWLVSAVAYVEMMQAVALWLLIIAIVWTVFGGRILMQLLFPLLFIAFALPIWFPLSPLLQELTADVVFWVVRLLNVPAFRQEALIVLPTGMLSIEEACSGLRYLLAALTLSTLYGYLNYSRLRTRLLVVLVAALTAVFLNFVRVFIVVYLAYLTEMQHHFVHDHLMLGWYLFGGMMIILLFIDARLSRRSAAQDDAPKMNQLEGSSTRRKLNPWLALCLSVLLISAAPAAVFQLNTQTNTDNQLTEINAPAGLGGWNTVDGQNDDWMPTYHGALTVRQTYAKNARQVHLFLGHYPHQKQGKELINDLNRISDKKRWRNRYPRARVQQYGEFRMLEQVLEKGGIEDRLVWYWYQVAGMRTTSKYMAKILQVVGRLIGQPQASIIVVATRLDDNATARKRLDDFISNVQPARFKTTNQDISSK